MSPLEPGPIYAPAPRPGPPSQPPRRGRRRLDLALGILLGIVLGAAVAAGFVFLGAEETVDAPRIDSGGGQAQPPPARQAGQGGG